MSAKAWLGGDVTTFAHCIVANNPSPLTYVGTNTWILGAPGAQGCVVVDPGPDDADHIERVVAHVKATDRHVAAIVTTHAHADHAGGVRALSVLTGAPAFARADDTLPIGAFHVPDVGVSLEVLPLPGHSSDSAGIFVAEDGSVLTGDMIFAQSSTMVCWPDGVLADYMESLDALARFVEEKGVERLLTGHGYVIENPSERIMRARAHRMKRLNQVVAAVRSGIPARAEDIVDAVYNDVDPSLAQGAKRSVNAQLRYAFDKGLLEEH